MIKNIRLYCEYESCLKVLAQETGYGEYQIQAKEYIQKSLELRPNFIEAQELLN